MAKMVWLLSLFLLLHMTSPAQEPVELLLPLHDPTFSLRQPPLDAAQPITVQLRSEHLENVSGSVLAAETWLREYVLPFYPAINVTTIIVGHAVFCDGRHRRFLGHVPQAIRNLHYSLTRWGLQNDIKATTSLSSDCLDPSSEVYRADLAENHIKPLLITLRELGSPYVVNPPSIPGSDSFSGETFALLKSHSRSLKNLGVAHGYRVNFLISSPSPRTENPTSRKLSFIDTAVKAPLPPLVGTISPAAPHFLPSFSPAASPVSSPPFGPHLPPCEPSGGGGHAPSPGVLPALWCVAKPSVPAETLQEALDFPDTVAAHASYAFNSYWQKNKRSGGTCGFGGTAMLVNSDPSYSGCRYVVS